MHALVGSEQGAPWFLQIEAEKTTGAGVDGIAAIQHRLRLPIESQHLLHLKVAIRALVDCTRLDIKQIKMVVSIAATLHEGFGIIPRQEEKPIHGLYVLVVLFFVYLLLHPTRCHIVGNQAHVVLIAVQFKDIQRLAVGRPCQVGVVVIGGAHEVKPYDVALRHVEDTHLYLMAGFACHGVLVHRHRGYALRDIDLGITCHHALVHAIEGKAFTIGAPEGSFCDAKLVAMHALAVNNIVGAVGRAILTHGQFLALGCHHIEVTQSGKSQITRCLIEVLPFGALWNGLAPHHLALFPVNLQATAGATHLNDRTLCIGH